MHEGGRGATYDSKSPPSSSQAARMLGTKEPSYMIVQFTLNTRMVNQGLGEVFKHWTKSLVGWFPGTVIHYLSCSSWDTDPRAGKGLKVNLCPLYSKVITVETGIKYKCRIRVTDLLCRFKQL